jgi:hypothetical protein
MLHPQRVLQVAIKHTGRTSQEFPDSSPPKPASPGSSNQTLSMLNEAYWTCQEASWNEGHALLDEVRGINNTHAIMGDESSHKQFSLDTVVVLSCGGD